jgi:allantoin racemase
MEKNERNVIKIIDLIPVLITGKMKVGLRKRKDFSNKIEKETNGLVKLELVSIENGTSSIEGNYDEALNTLDILRKVKWAEQEGYDAVVIDCFGDPGLDAAREISNIPIIGANQSAIYLAAQLGGRFSIINILPEFEYLTRTLVIKYGLAQSLVSIRTIQIPVLELEKDSDITIAKIVEEAKKAIFEDGAGVIVLGCTGMFSIVNTVKERFAELNITIPVIEPFTAAFYNAVSTVLMGISHSKKTYMKPRDKYKNITLE